MFNVVRLGVIFLLLLNSTVTSGAFDREWEEYIPIDLMPEKYSQIKTFAEKNVLAVKLLDFRTKHYTIFDLNKNVKKKMNEAESLSLKVCKLNRIRFCPISRRLYEGATSFLYENRLYTCRHLFDDWLYAVFKHNNLFDFKNIVFPIIAKNYKGHEIYNTLLENDDLFVSRFLYYNSQIAFEYSDFIKRKAKLPKVVVAAREEADVLILERGINFTSNELLQFVTSAEMSYYFRSIGILVGYPVPIRKRNGNFEVKSFGTLVASIAGGDASIGLTFNSGMLMTYLSTAGSSGSPVFSSSGKILGVNCMGELNAVEEKENITTSYGNGGMLWADDEILIRVWKDFDAQFK